MNIKNREKNNRFSTLGFRPAEQRSKNDLLSATNLKATEGKIDINNFKKTQEILNENNQIGSQTRLKLKLTVYIDRQTNDKYIDAISARVLEYPNFGNMSNTEGYRKISDEMIERLKRDGYEIEQRDFKTKKEMQNDTIFGVNMLQSSKKNNISDDKVNSGVSPKYKLKVFVDAGTNKKYIEASVARALRNPKIRQILIGDSYEEISDEMIERLKRDGYEIECFEFEKKQTVRIYNDDGSYYIDSGAAYALSFIDVKAFYNSEDIYGPLTNKEFEYIKQKYNVELEEFESKKTR